MLSNQILQNTIHEIGNILECNCSIWNMNSELLAAFGNEKAFVKREVADFIQKLSTLKEEFIFTDKLALFLIKDGDEPIYILVLEHGGQMEARIPGRLCVSQFEALLEMNKVKMDKNRFIQNLLLDNLSEVDIYNQAKRLGISEEQNRVVFLIESKAKDDEIILEMVRGIYTSGMGDYVTAVDNGQVVLVKSLEDKEGLPEADEIAHMLVSIMNTEAMVGVRVAYGTVIHELNEVTQSYKEAGIALEVGKIFYAEKEVLAYKELGIGRLIHQLPESLCHVFLEEVFSGKESQIFDEETLSTIHQFFENNLNISETARQLFVHRNTLVHRLEKIQKYTGLDVRVFEDAVTLKIALMVADQVNYTKKNKKE